MRVYLACTVRGSRDGLAAARLVAERMSTLGHEVLTTHLLDEDVDSREESLDEQRVFERDVAWLDSCDVLIAEASGSTYGVGFEVGYVTGRSAETGQRVFVLYDATRRASISRLAIGYAAAAGRVVPYSSPDDVIAFLDEAFPLTDAARC